MFLFEFIFIIPLSYVFISTLYFSYNFENFPLIYCKLFFYVCYLRCVVK